MTSPGADAVAVATRVMRNLTGGRWTWPRRRVVEQYWVPETVHRINLSSRPVSTIVSVTGRDGSALEHQLWDGFRLDLPGLARCVGWFGFPDRDLEGGVYPTAWRNRRGTPVNVDYIYGNRPPYEMQLAINQLAEELDKFFQGAACALPQRVTSVSREGVNWTIIDPMQFLEGGKTGLYFPDMVLSSYGKRVQARARTFSPEHLPPRRLSTTILTGS